MFGTLAERSKILHEAEKARIDWNSITEGYNALGIHLDVYLALNDHIQNICKKSSRRPGLLCQIRPILTTNAAMELSKAVVQLVMTFCTIALLKLSKANEPRFKKIEKSALKIAFGAKHSNLTPGNHCFHKIIQFADLVLNA